MNAVGAVDIGVARRPEHDRVAAGWPAETVCGRVSLIVRLELNDAASDAIKQKVAPIRSGATS